MLCVLSVLLKHQSLEKNNREYVCSLKNEDTFVAKRFSSDFKPFSGKGGVVFRSVINVNHTRKNPYAMCYTKTKLAIEDI